jgi:heat shock protein HslJ
MKTDLQGKVMMGVGLALAAAACGGPAGRLTSPSSPPVEVAGSVQAQRRSGLVGHWQLVSVTEAGQAPVSVAEPERFTATFGADGRVALRADCNRCSASYTAQGDRLSVGPMACTRAQCSGAPLDTTFAALVQGATAWSAADGRLELRCDAGVLRLGR